MSYVRMVTTEEHGMANENPEEDVELATYRVLLRIADALESLADEAAMASAALSSIADNGIVVHEAVQP